MFLVQAVCDVGGTLQTEVFTQPVFDPTAGCPSYPGAPVVSFTLLSKEETNLYPIPSFPGETSKSPSLYFDDDFFGGDLQSGSIGDLGWKANNMNMFGLPAQPNHPGVVGSYLLNGIGSLELSNVIGPPILGSYYFDVTFIAMMIINNTNVGFKVGLMSAPDTDPFSDGLYIEKAKADTSFFGTARSSSIESRINTGIVANATWNSFRIRRINDTTIGFSLNYGQVPEVTLSSNIPLVGLKPSIQLDASGSPGFLQAMLIDKFSCYITNLQR